MKEWKNPFNSFNSWKGMLYYDWYKTIKLWKDGDVPAPLPPVECSLDPIHACNLMCDHCNAHKYLTSNKHPKMTNEHLLNLVEYLGKWGVKAICFGGGGEPTLHPKLEEALYISSNYGMESSIATNGTLFTPNLILAMLDNCRWVGVSVDAATAKTYKIGRKMDLFNKTIKNIEMLAKQGRKERSNCDVAYKFLIFDYNQTEIYEACKLAKELGVKDFHARPADMSHQGMGEFKDKAKAYNKAIITDQCERCHELENKNFHVYTVIHKFDKKLKPIKNFSQCYASPCCIQLCADNNIYLCPDQRHNKFYKLGTHYPKIDNIQKIWGSWKHYDLVFKTGKQNCNTRCTFSPYCKQCEELCIKNTDPMCKWFI